MIGIGWRTLPQHTHVVVCFVPCMLYKDTADDVLGSRSMCNPAISNVSNKSSAFSMNVRNVNASDVNRCGLALWQGPRSRYGTGTNGTNKRCVGTVACSSRRPSLVVTPLKVVECFRASTIRVYEMNPGVRSPSVPILGLLICSARKSPGSDRMPGSNGPGQKYSTRLW
jgi:hypothetical protein